MTFEIRKVRLGEVCEIKQGRYLAPSQMIHVPGNEGDVPVMGGNGILGYTTSTTHDFDVPLVTCRGSRCGLMQWGASPSWISNNAMAVWFKQGSGDNRFLFHYLRHADFDSVITGSAQPQITVTNLSNLEISLPESRVQVAIGNFMDSLEAKISINRGLIELLEQIAQTIFKSWFIDFDPVHAKSRGEQPEGMDAETAALFPDSFEESETGLIPSGWKAGSVSDLCSKVVNGSTPSRGNRDFWEFGDFPWFKTGELADNFLIDSSESISAMAVNQTSVKVLPSGSVLMAIYAAPTVGRLGILTSEAAFNQACTGMVPLEEVGIGFLYLKLKESRGYFNSLAIGAAQQNISKGVVEDCPVLIPDLSVFAAFNKLVDPMFSMIERQTFQNVNLSSIRDALLPRLISGELEIPDELLVD